MKLNEKKLESMMTTCLQRQHTELLGPRDRRPHHVRCVPCTSGRIGIDVYRRETEIPQLMIHPQGSKRGFRGVQPRPVEDDGGPSRLIYCRPGRVGASFDLGTSLRSCPTGLHISFLRDSCPAYHCTLLG